MDRVFGKLRNLDAYPKVNEDFYSRSLSGGVITLVSSIVIALLFISEFRLYLHTVTETKLLVDTSRGGKLHINLDVTFPAIPCTLLSIDTMDISGERHLDIVHDASDFFQFIFHCLSNLRVVHHHLCLVMLLFSYSTIRPFDVCVIYTSLNLQRHDIFKKRIDSHGNVIGTRQDGIGAPKIERPLQRHGGRLEHNETYCGSCYGAETSDEECCNSCEEVREAYRKKGWGVTNTDLIDQCKREGFVQKVKEEEGEGCNIHGSLEVNKVAGNFHFAPGKSFHQQGANLIELLALQTESYNISHKINKLSFGDPIPGIVNPLDGVQWVQKMPNGVYQYFLKVVPTIYTNVRGHTIQSNQFSVTEHYKSSEEDHFRSPPGVFFFYDLSPIKVTFTEQHSSFLHFLTHICAIVGGVFTVAGIVDSFVYHGQRALKKKVQLGKLR